VLAVIIIKPQLVLADSPEKLNGIQERGYVEFVGLRLHARRRQMPGNTFRKNTGKIAATVTFSNRIPYYMELFHSQRIK
jgi:hypothetical protein